MVAQAQVILQFVEHAAAANDCTLASQRDHCIRVGDVNGARGVDLQVAQVTNVTDLVIGTAVIDLKKITTIN